MTRPVSHLEWFRNDPSYADVRRTVVPVGSHGVHLARAAQPEGVYHRPAAGEMSIQMPLHSGPAAVVDHGGKFHTQIKSSYLYLSPSDTDLCYDVRDDCEFIIAVLPKAFLERTDVGGHTDFGRLHSSEFSDELISALLRRLWTIGSRGHSICNLLADTALATLMVALREDADGVRGKSDDASADVARGGLAPWQLSRVRDAIEVQLDGDVGLSHLAAIAGLSPTHFSRAFKQSTGLSPFNWLRERRIERAKELLTDPRIPLVEVALAVGFSAQPEFTTAFKRATGTTPGAWRRERLL